MHAGVEEGMWWGLKQRYGVQLYHSPSTVHFASRAKKIPDILPHPNAAEGRIRDFLPAHRRHEMLAEAAESKTNRADLRFTLTFRPLASQQRNYRARGVIVPVAGR